MQDEGFSHADLYRRACRAARAQAARGGRRRRCAPRAARAERCGRRPRALFESCIAAIPYAPATAFLASEKAKLDPRREDGETPRVAILADGIGSTHGVTRTIEEIRQRGVPGFEIEVVGTDPEVDRRLSAVAEIDVPFYPGLQIGVPSLPAAVQTLADGRFDAIHVCSPGPVGIAGALVGRGLGAAAGGQLPHRADRLRRPALRRAARGGRDGARRERLLRRLRPRPLPQPGLRRGARRDRRARRAGRALGPRRRHRALRSGAARADARWRPTHGSTCSTPGASRARRASTCSPTRSCGPRARPAPAPRARGRRARAGAPARAPRRARHLPRLARGRRAGARLRERRHLPVPQRHRHLRPGDPRGAGQRPAGGRRRRGRARCR